ncbi:19524_t:CDS:2 [Rhizophagus irregularis]|nr:19524_t:CDS:2 [Rhizophagus irregularis]
MMIKNEEAGWRGMMIDNEALLKINFKRHRWLEQFVIAAEDLMRIVMLTINNECNKELEKLEDQKQDLSCKLYAAVINGSEKQQYMRQEQRRQQLCIMRENMSILEQLQSAYKELRNWKILGKRYIQKDIDDINNNRNDLDR